MAIQIIITKCEKCGDTHPDIKSAKICEAGHKQRFSLESIREEVAKESKFLDENPIKGKRNAKIQKKTSSN
ncbi:MAG: hypothetical protein JKY81_04765 [Colwellia sp.]|nr:hypothetical protein [Colwellia sp.]